MTAVYAVERFVDRGIDCLFTTREAAESYVDVRVNAASALDDSLLGVVEEPGYYRSHWTIVEYQLLTVVPPIPEKYGLFEGLPE